MVVSFEAFGLAPDTAEGVALERIFLTIAGWYPSGIELIRESIAGFVFSFHLRRVETGEFSSSFG